MARTFITVEEALEIVQAGVTPLPTEAVPLRLAHRRVAGPNLVSSVTLPPFANSSMDGYAVQASATAGATPDRPVILPVLQQIPAGQFISEPLPSGAAAHIMTGAPLPPAVDAVVRIEDTRLLDNGQVAILHAVAPGTAIREAGSDIRTGDTVVTAGQVMNAATIGLCAAVGMQTIACHRRPRIVIMGSGDELVQPGQPLTPGKIYDSNDTMLALLAEASGCEVTVFPVLADHQDALQSSFTEIVALAPDLIVTTGGVSMGEFDLIKRYLEEQGDLLFWQVQMRPGKPVAYARLAGIPVLALPGNPVSAFVGFSLFGRAIIRTMLGQSAVPQALTAITSTTISNDSGLRNYLRGYAAYEGIALHVQPASGQSSHQLATLAASNCLIVTEPDQRTVAAGEPVPILPLSGGWPGD